MFNHQNGKQKHQEQRGNWSLRGNTQIALTVEVPVWTVFIFLIIGATNCRHSGLVPFSKLFCHPNLHRHQNDLHKWFLSWLLREHGNTYWINTHTTIITAAMLLKAHFHLPKANQRDLNWCAHPREPLYWKTHRRQNLCGSSRVSPADWRTSPWHKTQHNGVSETLGNTTTPISPDFTALSYEWPSKQQPSRVLFTCVYEVGD